MSREMLQVINDPGNSFNHRFIHLKHLVNLCSGSDQDGHSEAKKMLKEMLDSLSKKNADEKVLEKAEQLDALITELKQGPMRMGTFMDVVSSGFGERAHVRMQDGASAFAMILGGLTHEELERGDAVGMAADGQAVLCKIPNMDTVGEEASFDKQFDDSRIEVSIKGESSVMFCSAYLQERIKKGEVKLGQKLLVSQYRCIAFDAVPESNNGLSRYRYLDRQPIPSVIVERDIGDPHPFIDELLEHVRIEMTDPSLRRKYKRDRCTMTLLSGSSGSGKTLSIEGLTRKLYELMAEITGVEMDALPQRVLRLRASEIFSMWLGESDKNLDRFFDEVESLADDTFEVKGKTYTLPVIAIGEEIDGLAQQRGNDASNTIYSRVLSTALTRMDTTYNRVSNRLVLYLFTTNEPQLIDHAFLRRSSSRTVHFGRLSKDGFVSVLDKQLQDMPLAGKKLKDKIIGNMTKSVFEENSPIVELLYAGTNEPDAKYARDFLNGALVNRAVQQAADMACRLEHQSKVKGITEKMLIEAFVGQIKSVVSQLREFNVSKYVDLPEGARVVNLRRI